MYWYLVDKIFLQDQHSCCFDNMNLCVYRLRQRKILARYLRWLKTLEKFKWRFCIYGTKWKQETQALSSALGGYLCLRLAPVWGFPGGTSGKEPACQCRSMPETRVQSLGQEDPLKEGMATHSSIPAWRIPWTRGAWQAIIHRATKSWTLLNGRGCMHTRG